MCKNNIDNQTVYICDCCEQPIVNINNGGLAWQDKPVHVGYSNNCGFIIAHKKCFGNEMDWMELHYAISQNGMANLIKMLIAREIADTKSFGQVMARLFIPNYEDARLMFDKAQLDGLLDGASDSAVLTQQVLKEVINYYE